ncbi:unnamed protein product [Mycena citricolor]|uniref:Glucose-methanol-choline oxidoreductase N-terminal domain-containing protein n=1 Tax=Mycena citricolor TaxID=2018698 RepID=A0AAD2H237_9AGAR|nr:unnamed protein product [Mycena citricolor]
MAPYDIIFAGGGTAACIIAGRLAAADPTLKILILEAGKHTKDVKTHQQPGRYFANLVGGGDSFTYHDTVPSKALGNRPYLLPSAKAMGGGSSVNFMIYTRASPSDYDDWRDLGNPGWGAEDLTPLSNKAESYEDTAAANHGTSGPIKVSTVEHTGIRIGTQFLDVATARDPERGTTDDTNSLTVDAINKYGRWNRYMSPQTGHRSDVAHHYIYNQLDQNKNLEVRAHCRVKRVIIEGDKAVGVEYISHAPGDPNADVVVSAFGSLIVVAGGAFGSPAILERSGIGAPALLKSLDIPEVVALPGVGENYNDHNRLLNAYHTSDDEVTMDKIFRGLDSDIKPFEDQFLAQGKGMMAHNGVDAGIKIRPNAKDLESLGPAFADRWANFFANNPDKPGVCAIRGLRGHVLRGPSDVDGAACRILRRKSQCRPGQLLRGGILHAIPLVDRTDAHCLVRPVHPAGDRARFPQHRRRRGRAPVVVQVDPRNLPAHGRVPRRVRPGPPAVCGGQPRGVRADGRARRA